jgi:aminoglycoside/choline kinase family phosphotransferase
VTGVEIDEPRLGDDFETMADRLLNGDGLQVTGDEWGFMYRDFQARNVMIKNGEPYYIDFQGGRRGPVYYDLASFLWQAKAHYSKELRHRLLEAYIDESGMCFDRERLMHFVLFRTLQVLGAYGYRGLIERKEHFIESIPFAKENLRELFRENEYLRRDYPYLYAISDNI